MRPFRALVVCILLLLAAFAVPAAFAQTATSACAATVVDGAGVLGSNLGQVQRAAQGLIDQGADVHVQTVANLGGAATLDQYEQRLERGCASWQAPDGGRKNNLLVILVAPNDRLTGVYYGGQWDGAFGETWPRIQANVMNPRFRDGDFAGGLTAGMAQLQRQIEAQLQPGVQPAAPPADLSGLWRALGATLFAAFLLTGGVLAFRAGHGVIQGRQQRRISQQQARSAQRTVAARVAAYPDTIKEIALRLDLLATQVADSEVQVLRRRLADAQRLVDQATREYGLAHESVVDPEKEGLSAAEYDTIRHAYQELLPLAQQADEALASLRRDLEAIEQAIGNVPRAIQVAQDALAPAAARVQAVERQGYKTEQSTRLLEQAGDSATQAKEAADTKRFGEAARLATAAGELTTQAVTLAEQAPTQRTTLEGQADALAARLADTITAARSTQDILATLADTYAPPSWEQLEDAGTAMVGHIHTAQTLLDEARGGLSMQRQEWEQATTQLTQASTELDQAADLAKQVAALRTTLDQARQAAPQELAAAQAALAQAEDDARRLPDVMRRELAQTMDQGRRDLQLAEAELGQPRPDILQALTLARRAHTSATAALAQARHAWDVQTQRARQDDFTRGMLTSMLIDMALSGGRNRGRRRRGPPFPPMGPRGGPFGGGGGGSTGWGGSGGGGGSTGWGGSHGGGGSSRW